MMKKARFSAVSVGMAFAALVFAQSAHADDVVYSNGTPGLGGDNAFSNGKYVAEDFTLTSPVNVKSMSFNAWTNEFTSPITAVNLKFYTDSGGAPGTEFLSGTFAVAGSVQTGATTGLVASDYFVNFSSYGLYDGELDFNDGAPFGTGSFWMAVNIEPTQEDIHWSFPSSGALGSTSLISFDGGTTYASNNGWDHAFKLYGTEYVAAVPEPETYAMMLAGLGLLGFAARRRKAQKTAA